MTRRKRAVSEREAGLLRLASVLSAVLILLALINGWIAYTSLKRLAEEDLELVRLAGQIVYLDEVLTHSARMAATTGNPRWLERYREAEPRLSNALTAAIELAPVGESDAFRLTAGAHRALVSLEAECLAAVEQGRREDARLLLFGERHDRLEREFVAGVDEVVTQFRARTDRSVRSARAWTLAGSTAGVLAVAISFFVLFLGLRRAERERRLREELATAGRRSTIGRLAASLAHELNQPLAAVVNYTEAGLALATAPGSPEHPHRAQLAESLRGASEQAQRAGQIIHRIRNFTGTAHEGRTPVDANEAVRAAASLVGPQAKASGATLTIEPDRAQGLERPVVAADPVQLQQVLVNLIVNAAESVAQSGQPGSVKVRVRADRRHVEISVEDTGVGVSRDQLPRLFDAFYTTKDEGMGLGLAICRDIVETHRGDIECVPTEAGTRFVFRLPRHEPPRPRRGPTLTEAI